MKKYPYLVTGMAVFLTFGFALLGDGAQIACLITGQDAFVRSRCRTSPHPCRPRAAVVSEVSAKLLPCRPA